MIVYQFDASEMEKIIARLNAARAIIEDLEIDYAAGIKVLGAIAAIDVALRDLVELGGLSRES